MNEEHVTFHYSVKDGWKEITSPFEVDARGTLKIEGYFSSPQFSVGQEE